MLHESLCHDRPLPVGALPSPGTVVAVERVESACTLPNSSLDHVEPRALLPSSEARRSSPPRSSRGQPLRDGSVKGWISPRGPPCSALVRRHVGYERIYSATFDVLAHSEGEEHPVLARPKCQFQGSYDSPAQHLPAVVSSTDGISIAKVSRLFRSAGPCCPYISLSWSYDNLVRLLLALWELECYLLESEVGLLLGWFRGQSVFHQARRFLPFNRLFAAMYDLVFIKMTNMCYLIPSPYRTLKEYRYFHAELWQTKVHNTCTTLYNCIKIMYNSNKKIDQLQHKHCTQPCTQPLTKYFKIEL